MPALAFLEAAAVNPPAYPFAGDSIQFHGATNAALMFDDSHWSPALSDSLYKINGWGAPYFSVNSSGNISVRPYGAQTLPHQEIDLLKIVKKASESKSSGGLGLQLPLIVRLPDILKSRLESLQSAFDSAMTIQGYQSHYQGVYPVKCNQDRFIVEDIVQFGAPFRFGLEAGSKPELLLSMSCLCRGNPDALLICNGFKDAEYISLALLARRLALNTVIVLEQEEELGLVINVAQKLSVRPVIGLRAKLRTKHSGHFGATSGEKGKFGLTTSQILRVVAKLDEADMLDCLQLLHFHIGSQIPSTDLLNDGISEAAQIYCELVRLGAHMKVIDVGGGLGIDYDGSKSGDSDISVSYGLVEYAAAVVGAVQAACDRKSVNHPVICSESGRAIVSHHSILIFEAVSASVIETPDLPSPSVQYLLEGLSEESLSDYRDLTSAAIHGEYESCLLYADHLKQRSVEQFKEGSLGMERLAAVDSVCDLVSHLIRVSDTILTYRVNLSVFTSVPDFWGIGQLFPIVPIHRLDRRPSTRGIFSDLTCDSDGMIDKFIGGESSLPLHEMESGGYFLGMFLGGAYEEALGGLHNLFGGPSVVRVSQSDGPHTFAVTSAVSGPSCGDVLHAMNHEPKLMFETLKQRAEECCYGREEEDDGMTLLGLAAVFQGMPYLVDSAAAATPSRCLTVDSGNRGAGAEEEPWSYCYA